MAQTKTPPFAPAPGRSHRGAAQGQEVGQKRLQLPGTTANRQDDVTFKIHWCSKRELFFFILGEEECFKYAAPELKGCFDECSNTRCPGAKAAGILQPGQQPRGGAGPSAVCRGLRAAGGMKRSWPTDTEPKEKLLLKSTFPPAPSPSQPKRPLLLLYGERRSTNQVALTWPPADPGQAINEAWFFLNGLHQAVASISKRSLPISHRIHMSAPGACARCQGNTAPPSPSDDPTYFNILTLHSALTSFPGLSPHSQGMCQRTQALPPEPSDKLLTLTPPLGLSCKSQRPGPPPKP